MTQSLHTLDGKATGYGLGWILGLERRPVWHGGVQRGTTTALYLLPGRGYAVAVLFNLEEIGQAVATTAARVTDVVLR